MTVNENNSRVVEIKMEELKEFVLIVFGSECKYEWHKPAGYIIPN